MSAPVISASSVSHMEKPDQILYIWFISAYTDTINLNRSQHIFQFIKSLCSRTIVLVSEFPAGGIDKDDFAGFGIGEFD